MKTYITIFFPTISYKVPYRFHCLHKKVSTLFNGFKIPLYVVCHDVSFYYITKEHSESLS